MSDLLKDILLSFCSGSSSPDRLLPQVVLRNSK